MGFINRINTRCRENGIYTVICIIICINPEKEKYLKKFHNFVHIDILVFTCILFDVIDVWNVLEDNDCMNILSN